MSMAYPLLAHGVVRVNFWWSGLFISSTKKYINSVLLGATWLGKLAAFRRPRSHILQVKQKKNREKAGVKD